MSMILSWVLFPLVVAAVGLGWGSLVEWLGGGRVCASRLSIAARSWAGSSR